MFPWRREKERRQKRMQGWIDRGRGREEEGERGCVREGESGRERKRAREEERKRERERGEN